ncbi:hypothetical protein PHLGIDRAFT_241481 [Phlebiopsis gigantea 11061_1 CR5-6]|uniref:F-box domain-containing protein n=1 Tax=Phlebiopsis gigantea (strain 11061_1 CR5-6) TaxID=745531 RepID=A0A0C3SEE2_PHLG1|nr:hypothetical protein PHLGIDRAFT_241481 [Phlebiopsis gigantea 11061_1 CR5-6]
MDTLQTGQFGRLSGEERAHDEALLNARGEQVQDLILKLNSTNLAVTLPEELLLEIFKYHKAAWPHKIPTDEVTGLPLIANRTLDIYGWAVVTHVCRRWRNIGLGAPVLWTRIYISDPDLARASLERSRSLPLDVEGSFSLRISGKLSKTWRLVLKQSHRIRSLKYHNSHDELTETEEWFYEVSGCTFPILTTLQADIDPDYPISAEIPPTLEKLYYRPPLETLRINEVDFDDTRRLISSRLRHLELRDVRCKGTDHLAATRELLTTLKELPELQSLRLIDSLALYPINQPDPELPADLPLLLGKPVDLPHLSHLHASQKYGMTPVSVLLYNLAFPVSATVRLGTDALGDTIFGLGDVSQLGSLLSARISACANSDPPAPLRTLVIHAGGVTTEQSIAIAGWTQLLPVCSVSAYTATQYPSLLTPTPCLFELSVLNYIAENEVILNFLNPIPLQSVQTVTLGGDTAWAVSVPHTPLVLVFALIRALKVETLAVSGPWSACLPYLLHPLENLNTTPFPELHTLHIEFTPVARSETWMQLLTGALQARIDVGGGKRLRKIVVMDFGLVCVQDVQRLKEYTDEVVFNTNQR